MRIALLVDNGGNIVATAEQERVAGGLASFLRTLAANRPRYSGIGSCRLSCSRAWSNAATGAAVRTCSSQNTPS